MPVLAIILLFVSASLHSLWNFLLKQSEEKYIAMGWQVILSGIASIVLLFFIGLPPRSMWLFALVSGTLEAIYFLLLSYAYSDHDFSLVYPMARGSAPALLVLWSALFLRERLTAGGYLGLAMITGGMVIIGATSLLQNPENKPHLKGIAIALTVAFVISIYTLIDGTAVKDGPPLPYALSMFAMVPLITAPFLVRRYGWDRFVRAWSAQRVSLIVASALGVIAYLLALYAYTFAPLSYSGAIREVSVVIGAFLGWRFLGEEMGGIRVVGAAVIFAGVMVIAFFG
ncbi:MAG: DMT family transporter [Anaerolineales bacterium]|nr:DMT family transporter [Anaerolineales bacterium]